MSAEQLTLTGETAVDHDTTAKSLNNMALVLWRVGEELPNADTEAQLAEARRRAAERDLLEVTSE